MNKHHKDYTNKASGHHKALRKVLIDLPIAANNHILDIGCGDGRITAKLAKQVPHGTVTGLDIDPNFIESAQQQYNEEAYPNLNFVLSDALTMQLEKKFNIITSFAALHCITNHSDLLTTVNKLLKMDGRILFLFLITNQSNYDFLTSIRDLIEINPTQVSQLSNLISYFYTDSECYQKLLKQSGFQLEIVNVMDEFMEFPSRHSLYEFLKNNWISLSSRLPITVHHQVFNTLIDLHCPNQKDQDTHHYHIRWLGVIAKKVSSIDT
jgi:ubiquinone/menaquinone biosynthesis C-methylase UbiE